MRVGIVTNFNGRGLERDAEVVEALCSRAGHEITRVPWLNRTAERFDLAIYLEVAPAGSEVIAPRRWFVPNPEWYPAPGHGKWLGLEYFERVLCKTREAHRIFRAKTARAEYLGFASRDRLDVAIPRERRFLCVAGSSVAKGADAVIKAWELACLPYRLDIVGTLYAGKEHAMSNVCFRGHLDDGALRLLQNACLFHLQPSWTEGFGVTTHEALSCGALIASTDAPPMNELPAVRIAPAGTRSMQAAMAYRCSPREVAAAAISMVEMSDASVTEASRVSRAYYETSRREFEARFETLLRD